MSEKIVNKLFHGNCKGYIFKFHVYPFKINIKHAISKKQSSWPYMGLPCMYAKKVRIPCVFTVKSRHRAFLLDLARASLSYLSCVT